jgi:hypothetical protein
MCILKSGWQYGSIEHRLSRIEHLLKVSVIKQNAVAHDLSGHDKTLLFKSSNDITTALSHVSECYELLKELQQRL